ncbi:f-box protein [Quercus suber]|uniref:F-box protein n=1 Tax=Quercus suber TaxID=58331 RepID=A0AAW0LSM6_QUESU
MNPHNKKKISNLIKTRGPSTISDLPDEIILDILSRLPIKTLSQCRFQLVGSCNGLLCLSQSEYDGHFYICNPVLGEYKTLPLVSGITQYYAPFGFGFGFEYDPSNYEYKVVRLWCCMDMDNKFELVGEIYTLGCDRVSLRGGRALGMCHIQLRQIIL